MNDLWVALSFLSRLPTPKPNFSNQTNGIQFFPVAALILSIPSALLLWFLQNRCHPLGLALTVTITHLLITGCLHVDGFCDTCDGLGSGKKGADLLPVLKDSRIGAFGAVGLWCLLSAKVTVLYLLGLQRALTIPFIVSVVIARTVPLVDISVQHPTRGMAQLFHRPSLVALIFNGLFVGAILLCPWLLFRQPLINLLLPLGALLAGLGLLQWLRGYLQVNSGDFFGAVIETTELIGLILYLKWM